MYLDFIGLGCGFFELTEVSYKVLRFLGGDEWFWGLVRIFSNRLLLSSKEFSLPGTNILIDLDNFENPIGLDAILGPSLNEWLAETLMTTSPICHLTRAMIRVSLKCLTFPPVWLPWRHVSMISVVVFDNWSPNELNESYNCRNENTAGKSKPNLWHTYTNTFSYLFTEILTPTPLWANRHSHNHIVTYMIPPCKYSSPTQWCQQSKRNSGMCLDL